MSTSKLKTRILSALVLIPPVIVIVYMGGLLFSALLGIAIGFAVAEWMNLSKKTALPRFFMILGAAYLAFSFGSFYLLRELPEVGFALTVLIFVTVWASDSAAYLFGKLFGGPKLVPKISPNKTYAGLIGAMVGSSLILFAAHSLFDLFEIPNMRASYILLVSIGGVLGMVAQAGDLLVSMLKRAAKAKDSGDLIPGHGGILDRIDSLLLAAPVFYILVTKFIL